MRVAKLGAALLLAAALSCAPSKPNTEVALSAVAVDNNGVLPPGIVGQPYRYQFASSGGYLPYKFVLSSGTLPTGLTLGEATGTLSGTPQTAGDFSLTLTVSDSSTKVQNATITATLTVAPALDVPATPLADAVVGVAYTATLASTGGTAPIDWALQGGSLPRGLALDTATGVISGTPTRSGSYSFGVRAHESSPAAQAELQVFSIEVADTIVASAAAVSDGVVGAAYSYKVNLAGGIPPYDIKLTTGAPGIAAISATTGTLTGTPTTAGDYNLKLTVTDGASPTQTATVNLTFHVAAPLAFGAAAAPDGVRDSAYSFVPPVTGGTGDLSFRLTAGALADGLFLDPNTGRVMGAPTVTGAFTFTVRVTDSGRPAQVATKIYTFNVGDSLQSSAGLPEGTVGVAFTGQLTGSGGIAPYIWTANASLGNGLALATDGKVTGTPTTATPVIFTSTFRDSAVPPQSVTRSVTVAVYPPLAVSSTQLRDAVVGATYSDSIAVTGGHGPFTYALASGSMPAGLVLNANSGAITGTPTTAATVSLNLTVSDSGNPVRTATRTVGLNIRPQVVITTASLLDGSVGAVYAQTINVTGGLAPYTFAITFGTLPNGLAFDTSTGAITGTPTAAGTANSVQIRVTDSSAPAQVVTGTYNLNVYPALSISTTALKDAVVGTAYSDTLAITGGLGPFTYALTAGTMPAGLSLAPATGVISGNPSAAAAASLTFSVTDSANTPRTATRVVTLNARDPLNITTTSMPDGVLGVAYSSTLSVTGGLAPVAYQVVSGTLPAGLSLNTATGAITGTPTAAASSNPIQIRATDSSLPAQTAIANFNPGIYQVLAIANTPLRDGVVGVTYSDGLTISGGKAPFALSVAGTMPTGLSFNNATGAITGNPSAAAAPSLAFTVTDSASPPRTANRTLTLNVRAALTSSTSTLVDGVLGVAYNDTVVVAGGLAPYNFQLALGTLPAGLSLNAGTGAVTGTPVSPASSGSVQIQITDSSSPAQSILRPVSVATYNAIAIGATPLRDAVVGVSYSDGLAVTGGKAPLSYSVAPAVPNGLSLNAATGAITGTPTTAGSPSLTFTVTDSANPQRTANRTFTLNVRPLLSITTAQLADGAVGQGYGSTVATSGGFGPFTFTIPFGTLPRGLSLNASNGAITGTPTIAGSSTVQIRVTDSGNPAQVANATYNPNIRPVLASATTSLTNAVRGTPYSFTLAATGGSPPYSFGSVSMPAGITLAPATGVLSGNPTTAATTNVQFTITDSALPPQTIPVSLPLTVLPTLTFTTASLPPRVQNDATWTSTLAVTGGVAPYTFGTIGFLPAGVSLDSATGTLAGPGTKVGNSSLIFTVRDSGSPTQTAQVTLGLNIVGPLGLLPPSLPVGLQGSSYGTVTILRTGGVTPSVVFAGLPTGIVYDPGLGTLTGTPSVNGSFPVTATLNDVGPPAQGPIVVNYTLDVASALTVNPGALPNAIRDVPYAATLSTLGGNGPVTWSMTAGSLPAGLTFSSATGVISGTPTAAGGPFAVTFRASQAGPPNQFVDTVGLAITVRNPLAITTAELPTLQHNVAMTSFGLTATGGAGAYTWTALTPLPANLALSSAGALTGTPTAATSGTSVTFQVTDPGTPAQTATATLTLRVRDTLALNSTVLPNGVAGRAYSHQFGSTGGITPITWSVSAGSLPLGITLNAATGLLSGTSGSSGSSTFTVRATDGAPAPGAVFAETPVTLTFYPVLVLPTKALTDGSTLLPTYTDFLAASGGQGTYSYAVSGGALPYGVALNSGTGAFTGYSPTPTRPGSFTFQVTVTDGASPPQTASTLYSIYIGDGTLVSTWSAIADVPYNVNMAANPFVLTLNGGTAPYTYSLFGATPLPTGLVPSGWVAAPTTSSAAIVGTASIDPGVGSFQDYPPVTIQIIDSSGSPIIITRTFTVRVHHMDVLPSTWTVDGVAGDAFPATSVTTREAIGAVTWSISAGTIPTGLTVSSATATTGQIAGTINAGVTPGIYNFTVRATDSVGQQFDRAYSMRVFSQMAIAVGTFPDAYEGENYTALAFNFDAITSGGNPPYFTLVVNGTAVTAATPFSDPTSGLVIANGSAVTGTISASAGGTGPTLSTTYSYLVTRGDSAAPQQTVTRNLDLTVYRALQFANATLPDAVRGFAYPQTGLVSLLPSVSFGKTTGNPVQPYNFTPIANIGGSGLALAATGAITGTMAVGFVGDLAFSATVTDALGQTRTANFNLHVANPLLITTAAALEAGEVTFGYSKTLLASGGTGALTWSQIGGTLPSGLGLSTAGVLSGTPTTPGNFNFDVRVIDLGTPNQAAVRTFSMTVNARLQVTTTAADVPDAVNGAPYSFQLVSTDGTGTVNWTVTGGTLPTGLTLSTAGLISGIPSSGNASTVVFTATDSLTATPGGGPATATLTLNPFFFVQPIALTINQNLRGARENYYDGTTVTASGGRGAYTIVLNSGTLPPGTSLSQSGTTADIKGLLTTTGQTTAVLQVTDTGNPAHSTTTSVTITVDPPFYLSAYDDISATTPLAEAALSGGGCDDGYWTVPLPFAFRFHDQTVNTAYVGTNGLVAFNPAGATSFSPNLPSPGLPNAIIAPRWEDLWTCSTGSVHVQTFGTAPHRFTVIQWKDVGFFWDVANSLPDTQKAKVNFEVVLHESSNAIQTLYAPTTNGYSTGTGDQYYARNDGHLAAVGIEDQFGVGATSFTPANKLVSGLALTWTRNTATSYTQNDVRANLPGAFTSIRNSPTAAPLSTALMASDNSINVALPFSFPFYGTGSGGTPVDATYTTVSISPNGGLVLHSNPALVVQLTDANLALTDTSIPGTVVAPFWDDLTVAVLQAPLAWVGTETFGTAPYRRFVVEWSNVALVGDTTSQLNFQAILYETTGRIEFAYGAMLAAAPFTTAAAGGGATVGIATKNATQRQVTMAYNWNGGGSINPALAGGLAQGDVIEFFPTDYGMFDYRTEVVTDNLVDLITGGFGYHTNDAAVTPAGGNPDLSLVSSSNGNSYANVALGFTLNYFGTPATRITLNTGGVLIPEAGRTTNLGPTNAVLGTVAAPNNVLAPFWDNLDPTITGGNVRVRTLGAAGSRRFIAEWSDVAIRDNSNVDTLARVTFETVLSEGSNEVEFIYGTLNGGTGQAQGNACSVGIDNASGTSNLLFVNNVPGPGTQPIYRGLSFRMKP